MHAMPLLTRLNGLYASAGLRVTREFQSQVKIYVAAVYSVLLLGACGRGRGWPGRRREGWRDARVSTGTCHSPHAPCLSLHPPHPHPTHHLRAAMGALLFPAITRVDRGIRDKQSMLLLLPAQVVDHTPAVMLMINRCAQRARALVGGIA